MQLALERILDERRLPRVLDPLRRDRRGRALRAPAAGGRVDADGEGLRLRRRGRPADRRADVAAGHELLGETQFTEMYAMDFPSDAILMSHMGEGNWASRATTASRA